MSTRNNRTAEAAPGRKSEAGAMRRQVATGWAAFAARRGLWRKPRTHAGKSNAGPACFKP